MNTAVGSAERGPWPAVRVPEETPRERPAPLDAGLVRAHRAGGDADAERRARVARRQRRPPSPRRDRRPHPRARARCAQTVERLVREHAPDVVGLSVMTFQRRTALQDRRARARAPARGARSSSAATTRASRPRPTRIRRAASTSSCAARASSRSASCCARSSAAAARGAIAGPVVPATGDRSVDNPHRPGRAAWRRRGSRCRIAARACSTATRCSAARSTSSRRRAAARSTAASARSSRCAAATSTPGRSIACSPTSPTPATRGARAIFLVDDNITLDVAPLRGAVPRPSSTRGLHDVDYIVQAMTSSIADARRRRSRR